MMARGTSSPRLTWVHLIVGFLFITSASAAITSQFQNFYQQHRYQYDYILHHDCSQEYANYLTGRPDDFERDALGGGGKKTVLVQPVVNCLLDNVSEYIKAASASAQVILGVTPPLLATLGASTDELAMLSVVGRRPLLALLVSFGTPSVYMERVFDFRKPESMLQHSRGQFRLGKLNGTVNHWILVVLQYVIAVGAAANVAELAWRLGIGTVCSFWAETVYAPLVWTILIIPIHLAGVLALRLRLRRIHNDEDHDHGLTFGQWLRLVPTKLCDFCKSEWVPAMAQEEVKVQAFEESGIYLAWSWFLSAATIIHIIFGSLVLSSLLFIGPSDALPVIFRYFFSVLV